MDGDDDMEAQPVELEAEAAVPAMECREKEEGGATGRLGGSRESRDGGEPLAVWRRRCG